MRAVSNAGTFAMNAASPWARRWASGSSIINYSVPRNDDEMRRREEIAV